MAATRASTRGLRRATGRSLVWSLEELVPIPVEQRRSPTARNPPVKGECFGRCGGDRSFDVGGGGSVRSDPILVFGWGNQVVRGCRRDSGYRGGRRRQRPCSCRENAGSLTAGASSPFSGSQAVLLGAAGTLGRVLLSSYRSSASGGLEDDRSRGCPGVEHGDAISQPPRERRPAGGRPMDSFRRNGSCRSRDGRGRQRPAPPERVSAGDSLATRRERSRRPRKSVVVARDTRRSRPVVDQDAGGALSPMASPSDLVHRGGAARGRPGPVAMASSGCPSE